MQVLARLLFLPFLLGWLALSGCRSARPSELPKDEPWLVAVKSASLPEGMPWYTRFAEHTWVDFKCGSEEEWLRIEVMGSEEGARLHRLRPSLARRDWRWGDRPVRLQRSFEGEPARRIAEQLQQLHKVTKARYANGGYQAWPGPNSNTFVRELNQAVPELAFVFDHNAVGKDYVWLGAGLTPSGTGVQVDTLPLGFALGLEEGVELHLLQLTFALRLWPPRLALPALPTIPWEQTSETPLAVRSCPTEADLIVTIPALDNEGFGRMSVEHKMSGFAHIRPKPESRFLFSLVDSSCWVYVILEGAQDQAVLVSVIVQGEERREQRIEAAFDADGQAEIGTFQVEELKLILQLKRSPEGVLQYLRYDMNVEEP